MNAKIAILAAGLLVFAFLLFQFWPRDTFEWHDETGYRWAELPARAPGQPGFTQLPPSDTKITFTNTLTRAQIAENRFLLGGSGVATGDVDGDGLIDVYFCGLDTTNMLYRNLGNWQFEDITQKAGVACPDRFSTGCALADLDGDGDLDLLVTALGGPNAYFLNDGTGAFTEVTETAGLSSDRGSTSLALADIDADGDLDLYITNFKKISVESLYSPRERSHKLVTKKVGAAYEVVPEFQQHYRIEMIDDQPYLFERPEADFLYLNDGKGHFTAVAPGDRRFRDEKGMPVGDMRDWGLLARFQDMDNDGDPDIYVCNDYWSPDRIWINDGTGHFQAIENMAVRHTSKFTMAVDFADFDRDGDTDFLLIDMLARDHQRRMQQMGTNNPVPSVPGRFDTRLQIKRNTLHLNRGDLTFAEIGQFSGIEASEWTWSVRFIDVDLDGYEDILATNGQLHDFEDTDTNDRVQRLSSFGYDYRKLTPLYPEYLTPNVAYRNKGDLTFEDVSAKWGFAEPDIAWGMALADFDNDGDLDIATNRLYKKAGIFRNEASAPRIAVRLKGQAPNTRAIGAKIRVSGGPVAQSTELIAGGTYLSSSDPLAVFAADDTARLSISVIWPGGKVSSITAAQPNRLYEIDEASATPQRRIETNAGPVSPMFEDASHLIDHVHRENDFDDFQKQPSLPRRLSHPGPGVAWHDIDGDGDDDLIISGGKGGRPAFYRNDRGKGFSRIAGPRLAKPLQYDQTAVLGWTAQKGETAVLIASSNFEQRRPERAFFARYVFKAGTLAAVTKQPSGMASIGALAIADYDGDGDLDLFVGGHSLPARYPESAASKIYRNDNGRFSLDTANAEAFKNIGMVTGAVFSDLDNDAKQDLILAIEWGPVTVFRNRDGVFRNATAELGLAELTGRWNGVTTGDFDEDGDQDIIATNWGLNTAYKASTGRPLILYYGDFDNNGTLDLIEAHYDSALDKIVPERSLAFFSRTVPAVRGWTATHKRFAVASAGEIIGKPLEQFRHVSATTLAQTLFLNQGNRFEARALPDEAQFTPAFQASVADFDGDGHEDIFMSQNFFAFQDETHRQDAGRGLWLRGDGTGEFAAVPGQVSGVKVYGEQRGAAVADFDLDGRVDLAVSQNGAATRLYRNIGGKPGLRVRLIGPTNNPAGIGAVLRIVCETASGPAREIHAGSGYLSQDSAVQVMGLREGAKRLTVRWPGGKISRVPLTDAATEVVVRWGGKR